MIQIHYLYDQNLDQLINRLECHCFLSIGWFASNYMNLNIEKYQLLISESEKIGNYVGEDKILETSNVELLGILIENQFKFYRHASNLC